MNSKNKDYVRYYFEQKAFEHSAELVKRYRRYCNTLKRIVIIESAAAVILALLLIRMCIYG